MKRRARPLWVLCVMLLLGVRAAAAQDVLRVYGPGGPYEEMREAAAEFSRIAQG